MGKAVSYALSQWESLEVYLKKPVIEIDNNLVENAIRPTALGKKNWLFFGDADAGERSAVIYSIIESCRRHDVALHLYARHPQSLALTDQSSNQGHRSKSLGRSNKKCCSSSSVNTANVVTQNYDLLSSLQSIGYSKVPGVTLTIQTPKDVGIRNE
jgi:hypothetical protein